VTIAACATCELPRAASTATISEASATTVDSLRRRKLPRDVALRDVGNFVRDDRRELRFALRGDHQPAVHADESAWPRERIQRRVAQREQLEILLRRGQLCNQPVGKAVQVAADLRVIDVIAFAHPRLAPQGLTDAPFERRRQIRLGGIAEIGQILRGHGKRHEQKHDESRPQAAHGEELGHGNAMIPAQIERSFGCRTGDEHMSSRATEATHRGIDGMQAGGIPAAFARKDAVIVTIRAPGVSWSMPPQADVTPHPFKPTHPMSSIPVGSHALLLIEDAPEDVKLITTALRSIVPSEQIKVAASGEEALDYLFGRGNYAGRDTRNQPALIMLDLSLPRINGLEVLRLVRSDPQTHVLPVVVVSASSQQRDIRMAAQLGANSFVRKSLDFVSFSETLTLLARYWLELNIPPPHPSAMTR
jgi:two-component system response regulator